MCMCQNEYESGIKNKKMTESINGMMRYVPVRTNVLRVCQYECKSEKKELVKVKNDPEMSARP